MRKQLMAIVAAFALMLIAGSPAVAADRLGLSSDGVTFSHHLPTLFSPSFIWVPGDTQSETFYARNQGGSTAQLSVDLLGNHIGDLLDSGDVHITAAAPGGISHTASDGAEHLLLTVDHVGDTDVVPVTVTVNFDFSSPNATEFRSTDLRFRVNLTQTANSSDGGNDSGDISGVLPDTGAPSITGTLALAAILLGTGLAILSRRRQPHQGDSHV